MEVVPYLTFQKSSLNTPSTLQLDFANSKRANFHFAFRQGKEENVQRIPWNYLKVVLGLRAWALKSKVR